MTPRLRFRSPRVDTTLQQFPRTFPSSSHFKDQLVPGQEPQFKAMANFEVPPEGVQDRRYEPPPPPRSAPALQPGAQWLRIAVRSDHQGMMSGPRSIGWSHDEAFEPFLQPLELGSGLAGHLGEVSSRPQGP